jgi:hypothetical protein
MMTSIVEINGCKHYFLNEQGTQDLYFIHSTFFVELDYKLSHPLGKVYKPKGCNDTLIRFVRQPNNSTLMFKENEWNVYKNPYFIPARKLTWGDIVNRINEKYGKET